ncbi:hypothetical protein MBLNU13_g01775t2 [Cladosporium sp. NU13]
MNRLLETFRRPGRRQEVPGLAPTQRHGWSRFEECVSCDPSQACGHKGYQTKTKERRVDRWLDMVVRASGSEPVFLIIMAALLAWAFAGVKLYHEIDWQVMISDVQAILSYLFDSLLMRQQLNGYEEALRVSAELRSRGASNLRMLRQITRDSCGGRCLPETKHGKAPARTQFSPDLPSDSLLGRVTTFVAGCSGHVLAVGFYWSTIVVWLAFGPSNGWSDQWQLYCNSATSALMVFVFAFLANVREMHARYTAKCLDATYRIDATLEERLRALTRDESMNEPFVVLAPRVNWLQRAIFYYADLVGTLVGIVLLVVVIVVWIAVGPVMRFSDNW